MAFLRSQPGNEGGGVIHDYRIDFALLTKGLNLKNTRVSTGGVSELLDPKPETTSQEWEPEQVRFTAFTAPLFRTTAEEVFRITAGEDPTKMSHDKQQRSQTAEGPFGAGTLSVTLVPGRIDWVYALQEEPLQVSFATLGPLSGSVQTAQPAFQKWLQTEPSLNRMACGFILLRTSKDRASGYREIQPYLHHVQLDPEGSSDFMFQINRPRDYLLDNEPLKINRVSQWSVAAKIFQTHSISPQEGIVRVQSHSALAACRVSLDINTAADRAVELPKSKLAAIHELLVDFAVELAEKGDIP